MYGLLAALGIMYLWIGLSMSPATQYGCASYPIMALTRDLAHLLLKMTSAEDNCGVLAHSQEHHSLLMQVLIPAAISIL